MADKPSRAVVVYGDGFAPLVEHSHTNLHALASLGSCGFLALRAPPSPPSSDCQPSGDVRELAQLLDAYDSFDALNKELGEIDNTLQLQKRFMGLRAALFTATTSIGSFARKVGFSVFEVDELIKKSTSPVVSSMASELLNLLGFSGGKVSEKNDFDLVFLHIKAGQQLKVPKDKITINAGVDWLDKFIGELLGISPPGSEIAARLHISLVLSYGDASESEGQKTSISMLPTEESSDLSLLRPCQSYTMKGGKLLNDIRHHHPMLVAQWQEAVTRRDTTKEFSYKEFQEHGGYLAILADRFLHEVAFKLWKAPNLKENLCREDEVIRCAVADVFHGCPWKLQNMLAALVEGEVTPELSPGKPSLCFGEAGWLTQGILAHPKIPRVISILTPSLG